MDLNQYLSRCKRDTLPIELIASRILLEIEFILLRLVEK